MPRIRLCDDDLAKYSGPEWVELDLSQLHELDTGIVEEFEDLIDWSLREWATQVQRDKTKALRGMIWLARRLGGCKDRWADFWPNVYKADFEPLTGEQPKAADADPPAPANRAERRAGDRPSGRSKKSAT